MTKLPSVSGADAIRAFERIGYVVDRQRGSHEILRRSDPPFHRLVVPQHESLAKSTLRTLIRESGLSVDEFVALL